MLKVGIIGLGKMGLLRVDAIMKIPEIRLVATYDSNWRKNQFESYFATSSEEIFKNPDIDAVFICTPNYLNKELTIKSLESGKHVFCEKPPALNGAELDKVISVEKRTSKVLMYGFNHRQHPSIQKINELIAKGEFGKILWMRGRYGKSVDQTFFTDWRSNKQLAGGGILIDQGIHMLDLLSYFGGGFDQVHASVSNLYWNLEVEDNVFATLENSSTGVVASLHSTMTQWRHLFSLEVFLERGYLVLNGLQTSSNTYGKEVLTVAKSRTVAPAATWEDEQHFSFVEDKSWELEIREFNNAVIGDRKPEFGTSDEARSIMTLVDKIYSFRK